MSPGAANEATIRRHRVVLDQILAQLARHVGKDTSALDDMDERWAVERGCSYALSRCSISQRTLRERW
jgi:hypothetical protein